MKKSINPDAIDIQKRFFAALDAGIESGKITGLKTFCDSHALNRTKYSQIRTAMSNGTPSPYKIIDLDALSGACRDLGVSPRWLLLGVGNMYIE